MEGKYSAFDVAKVVISIANKNDFITQLQLQKILYYVQGNFMAEFGYKAFRENIEAWSYGPVVKEIWEDFSRYGRSPIPNYDNLIEMSNQETQLLNSVVNDKININVWELVDKTHEELPWKNAISKNIITISENDILMEFKKYE